MSHWYILLYCPKFLGVTVFLKNCFQNLNSITVLSLTLANRYHYRSQSTITNFHYIIQCQPWLGNKRKFLFAGPDRVTLPILAQFSFQYPRKLQKTGLMSISGRIEIEHWAKLGYIINTLISADHNMSESIITGFDLTFQKWFVNFPNENLRKTYLRGLSCAL